MSVRLAILTGLAAFGLAACTEGKSENPRAEQVRAVVAQTVQFEPRTPTRSFVGTVRPRVESDLAFRVGGKVAERLVTTGDRVHAGQVLARLDAIDLGLQKEQAEAEVVAARASLAQAEAEDRRIAQLRRDGWSTASAFDRQRAAVEEARGRLHRAERSLSLAANNLTYATLVADADGIITATMIEPGQVVAQGSPSVRLARGGEREAVVAIPEALIDRVRSGVATVSLWSEPGTVYQAGLRELSPSADTATRTYQARFTIANPPPGLELGLTATLTLADRADERIARLPLSALFNQGQGPSVFVVGPEGQLMLKPVEIAAYEAREVLIRAGLSEGDRVVTLGVQKLDLSQRVRVVGPQV
jgi:RND family efflux transporter MFP subunit